MDEALSQLRDIHLPQPVSWWPPATGWWVLLLLTVALLGLLFWWRLKRRRRQAPLRAASAALAQLEQAYQGQRDAVRLVQELSVLLRRIALTLAPREQVASRHGEAWLGQLDDLACGIYFQSELGRTLLLAPYQKDPAIDGNALLQLTRNWLNGVARHV